MTEQTNSSTKTILYGGLALVAALVLGLFLLNGRNTWSGRGEVVPPEVAGSFSAGLAALDVESNEHAKQLFEAAVQTEPREPALWADLAVAQMRLQDLKSAQVSLEKAASLAKEAPELAVLRAELLQEEGNAEAAIEQWRKVYQDRPNNVAAAYSLATLLGQLSTNDADEERLMLLAKILQADPNNLRVRCEQARLAATLEKREALEESVSALNSKASGGPVAAQSQLSKVKEAVAASQFREAATQLTFLENILKPQPAYQDSLARLGVAPSAAAVGTPVRSFLKLKLPPVAAAKADLKLTFEVQSQETTGKPDVVLAMLTQEARRPILLTLYQSLLHAGESAIPFPGYSQGAGLASVLAADFNDDSWQDLVLAGPEGCHLYLQSKDGSFARRELELPEASQPWQAAWALDLESDGDLDLVLSAGEGRLTWLQNKGDATFATVESPIQSEAVVQLVPVDLDQDGTPDLATLDAAGALTVWLSERGGKFSAPLKPANEAVLALAPADWNRDGRFDLVALSGTGEIASLTLGDDKQWKSTAIGKWTQLPTSPEPKAGEVFLNLADLDNNGAVDVIVSTHSYCALWLADASGLATRLESVPEMFVTGVCDMNDDGLLDLIGSTADAAVTAINHSQAGYAWQTIEPRAIPGAGDKRINAFGVGGRIEVRAGSLVQGAMIQGPKVHFGLGNHAQADVARIVWPNGSFQAEFNLAARKASIAQQRLKGSCPWLFAFDGQQYRFVKDLIWRSPLGLRINGQDTAGVLQTEDWIKVPGDLLRESEGKYLLTITAELWETHYFDHVALLAVDHPPNTAVFVDERFVPQEMQRKEVFVTSLPKPVVQAIDQAGQRVDDELKTADGIYVTSFPLGDYQGRASDHWIEFALPDDIDRSRKVLLVGNAWLYPTDSSLNVAISQSKLEPPLDLVLEQQDSAGQWQLVRESLGFPAGKNKDVVIDIPAEALAGTNRFRLRTNLEIYWDTLGWTYVEQDDAAELTPAPLQVATLRHRGFSKLKPIDRRRPDTPLYEIESTSPRWLDLEGFHTRFGDVLPLLEKVEDRYVIMNAGDELALEFAALPLKDGCVRDFVMIGDGWEKDGDFNTAFSRWVLPLPSHDDPQYDGPLVNLEQDPVYQRHAEDWQNYHTRYVTPRHFQRSLWAERNDEKELQP
jgi:thioredoxin-like negative regulator of GroEL